MEFRNEMELEIDALSINESFARSTVAAFCVQMNPTIDELTDIKTAVSEAVTNSVVHAYPMMQGKVKIRVILGQDKVTIFVSDDGIGIENYEKARQPFFTTKPTEERSGMGFTVMESFMDLVTLSKNGKSGLVVKLEKIFTSNNNISMKTNKIAVGE